MLGSATNVFLDWVGTIGPASWLLLFLAILLIIILSIFVRYLIFSWATGGLIHAVDRTLAGENADLKTSSPKGISLIKRLIVLGMISTAIGAVFFLGLPTIWLIIYFVIKNIQILATLWIVLGIVTGVFGFILVLIIFSMVQIYAQRLVVIKDYSPWEAWKKALSLSKTGFFPTLIMGILNSIIGTSIGCFSSIILAVILGIPGFVLIYPSIRDKTMPSVTVIVLLVCAFMIFIWASFLVRALLVVFKYSNWNQIFTYVFQKKQEANK